MAHLRETREADRSFATLPCKNTILSFLAVFTGLASWDSHLCSASFSFMGSVFQALVLT